MDELNVVGAEMNSLMSKYQKMMEELQIAYGLSEKLKKDIENDKEWVGNSANHFLEYADILSQYQYELIKNQNGNPVEEAYDAFEELEKNINNFYDDLIEFQKMEEIN